MATHMPGDDQRIFLTPVQLSSPESSQRHQPPYDAEETDERGDVIFRFRLDPEASEGQLTLSEFYQKHLQDLLKIVRFYHQGTPVLVDAFAFLNDPEKLLPILPQK